MDSICKGVQVKQVSKEFQNKTGLNDKTRLGRSTTSPQCDRQRDGCTKYTRVIYMTHLFYNLYI